MRAADFPAMIDRLMSRLEAMPGQWPLAGGVISVVNRDEVLAIRSFGSANLDRGEAMTAGHLFEIGSISKIFTGMLVMQLVAAGMLDLDAPASRYLPWLAVETRFPPFTLRHLLHHSAGLIKGSDDPPDPAGQSWALRFSSTGSAPGTLFHYSNLGYILLGLIIKAVSGESAATRCQRMILQPAGMSASLGRVSNRDRSRLATGYVPAVDDEPWVPGDALTPAPWLEVDAADGNVASNAHDMARFARLLLGAGSIDGGAVLDEAAFRAMIGSWGPGGEDWISQLGDLGMESSRYALGVNVERVRGHHCLTHGGGMVGYSTFLLVDLTANIGIVALTNANGDCPMGQIIARLAHEMLVHGRDEFPSLDLVLRAGDASFAPEMLGRFVADVQPVNQAGPVDQAGLVNQAGLAELEIALQAGSVAISGGGVTGQLFRSWSLRFATNHPLLRKFNLTFKRRGAGAVWCHGARVYRPVATRSAVAVPTSPDITRADVARWQSYAGRYRGYSPWYPTFRLVVREEKLFLVAPGGVEAPTEDVELVELAPGMFRQGIEAEMPERLVIEGLIEGRPVTVLRDGCRYSRTDFD